MKLIIVRHGHYLGNNPLPQDQLAQMSKDDWDKIDLLGLSPQGTEQAYCAQEKLRDTEIDWIYSSPIPRARETAEIIKGRRTIPLEFLEELREIPPITFPGAPPDFQCDEGANYLQAKALEQILRERHGDNDETILAVTHGNLIATLLSSLLGLGPCGYNRFIGFANCSVLEIILRNPKLVQIIWPM